MKPKKQILNVRIKSYTDKLNECQTWQQVMALKNTDDEKWNNNVVVATQDWLESFSNEESLWADNSTLKTTYDELLDEIELLLDEDDLSIFLLTYQGHGSLRWVADKMGKSHENIRNRLIYIKQYLKNNLSTKYRTLWEGTYAKDDPQS